MKRYRPGTDIVTLLFFLSCGMLALEHGSRYGGRCVGFTATTTTTVPTTAATTTTRTRTALSSPLLTATTPTRTATSSSSSSSSGRRRRRHQEAFTALSLSASAPSSSIPPVKDPNSNNKDSIRKDIDAMREEAIRRLDALAEQMEDLKRTEAAVAAEAAAAAAAAAATATAATARDPEAPPTKKKPVTKEASPPVVKGSNTVEQQQQQQQQHPTKREKEERKSSSAVSTSAKATASSSSSSSSSAAAAAAVPQSPLPKRTDLLQDTRWKIVFNVGREPGSWMPKEWGASGHRLLFTVVAEFTADDLVGDGPADDFLEGAAGAKKLRVAEAWLVPTGVGADSIGRRPIRVKSAGGYKVMPAGGPHGTDIVRLYVELEQEVHRHHYTAAGIEREATVAEDDVYCPAGRVYGTCGYFPLRSSIETDARHRRSPKDVLQEEHRAAVVRCAQIQQELDSDERVFSWEKMNKYRESMRAQKDMQSIAKRLQEARQREPDKSELRKARTGKVALTKEGGVCCKVRKGLAVEYHILGRMELGCVPHPNETKDHQHDEYEDLVERLHP